MEIYKNLGGNSNVNSYETGDAYIKVKFNDGSIYLYTYSSAGSANIEEMKRLAVKGEGLNSYINKYVKKMYHSKT